jgi:hypothetical protein
MGMANICTFSEYVALREGTRRTTTTRLGAKPKPPNPFPPTVRPVTEIVPQHLVGKLPAAASQ